MCYPCHQCGRCERGKLKPLGVCLKCKHQNEPGVKVCAKCGAKMPLMPGKTE